MWSSNVTKAVSCLGRAVNHAWLSALCSSRTCLCSHLSLWAAPGYQRQQPFIATHTENQGNKESSEMSGYMAAWGRGPYEEGQMEGSGPQQCQAHWHTFRPLTAGASRAGVGVWLVSGWLQDGNQSSVQLRLLPPPCFGSKQVCAHSSQAEFGFLTTLLSLAF